VSQLSRQKKAYNPSELATLSKKIKISPDYNQVPFCNAVQSLKASKISEAGSRSSGLNYEGSSHVGDKNKASDRDRTKSGHGRSSDSTGTGKQPAREPPPCLNTKKCAGEKHYLSDCPHTGNDEAIVLLSEYKIKRDADKKKASFKTLGNNGAISDNRDGHTAQCCGGRKETWLPSQGRGVAGAHHAEHIIQGKSDKQKCSAKRCSCDR
jgi:hypothetical protein